MKAYRKNMLSLVALLIAGIGPCTAQWESPMETDRKLRAAYHELTARPDTEKQLKFFRAFPDTWGAFVSLDRHLAFGTDDDKKYIYKYLNALKGLTAINDTLYCIKLMNLANGADLDADAPNMFHSLLHEKLGCHATGCNGQVASDRMMHTMFWLLSQVQKGEQMRFWQFYWSSIYHEEDGGSIDHRHDTEVVRIRQMMEHCHPELIEPMTIAYEYFNGGIYFLSDSYDARYFGITDGQVP